MSDGVVYVVDDDASVRRALARLIGSPDSRSRRSPPRRPSATHAPDRPRCLVLDVQLPGESGLDLQAVLGDTRHQLPIIFVTGHGTVPASVHAMADRSRRLLTASSRSREG
jgi:FixJ family two-component response regulator